MSFDSDYSDIAAQLLSDRFNDSDAMAVLGVLYEQHLIPDAALEIYSDDLAFTLYEKSARAGSSIGRFYLALAHYYGYPSADQAET